MVQTLKPSPKNHDLLALVKGARNGLVYGCKVREYRQLIVTCLAIGDGTLCSCLPGARWLRWRSAADVRLSSCAGDDFSVL